MADRVREVMEAMVPELDDMLKRNLLRPEELDALTKRRQALEYKCHQLKPDKANFLHYLELELNLEQLLKYRLKRMKLPKSTPTLHALRRRVHFIFSRALNRFRGDETLWLQWIDYCERTKAPQRLARVYGRALALLPRSPPLWVRAAAYEFEGRHNSKSARKLLQRAIRINPRSAELWQAYFRFELIFAEKVRRRREFLGLGGQPESGPADEMDGNSDDDDDEVDDDEGSVGRDAESDMDEGGDSGDEEEAGESDDSVDSADARSGEDSIEETTTAKWLAVPRHVFLQLAATLCEEPSAQLACLQTVNDFGAPAASLRRFIAQHLLASFGADANVAVTLGRMELERRLEQSAPSAAASATLRTLAKRAVHATSRAATTATWSAHTILSEELLRGGPASAYAATRALALSGTKSAHRAKAASADSYLLSAVLELLPAGLPIGGLPSLARLACYEPVLRRIVREADSKQLAAAAQMCSAGAMRHPSSAPLACLSLRLKDPDTRAAVDSLRAATSAAALALDEAGSAALWAIWISLLTESSDASAAPSAVVASFQETRATVSCRLAVAHMSEVIAKWLATALPLRKARALRSAVVDSQTPPSDGALVALIEQESAELNSAHRGQLPSTARTLCERAVAEHGSSSSAVWLAYARCLFRVGDFSGAAALHRRALRELESSGGDDGGHLGAFMAGWTSLNTGEPSEGMREDDSES